METEDGAAEMTVTTDDRVPVWSVVLQREFKSHVAYDHVDMNKRSREPIDTLVEAPCFCRDATDLGGMCERYADDESRCLVECR